MRNIYTFKRKDRSDLTVAEMADNSICYDFIGNNYGCAEDESKRTGVEYIAVTFKADGSNPFFTIPKEDLEMIGKVDNIEEADIKNIQPGEYCRFVASRIKPGEEIADSLTGEEANLWHLATGVAGEAGELLDAVKKSVIYRKPLDRENVIEELGDIEFYLEGIRQALGLYRSDVINANVAKLEKRYKKTFTNEEAISRNDKTN
jgi:NTP pyrophosphatase (non-canonical NTP hydrolase)